MNASGQTPAPIPPRGKYSRALCVLLWSVGIVSTVVTALLVFAADMPMTGHAGGDTPTGAYSVGWTAYNLSLPVLSLACGFSAALLALALSVTARQFSLRRLLLLTFAIAAAGALPHWLLEDYRDNARISIVSKQPVPDIVLERVKLRTAPDVALATLPPALLAELHLEPQSMTTQYWTLENGFDFRLTFNRRNNDTQNETLREFYSEYLGRVLDQELVAAGLPAPGLSPSQRTAGVRFWKNEKAWRERFDQTAPATTSAAR